VEKCEKICFMTLLVIVIISLSILVFTLGCVLMSSRIFITSLVC